MNLRWFISAKIRRATEMRNHVRKLLRAQHDILSEEKVSELERVLADTTQAIQENLPEDAMQQKLEALETAANACLRPYPYAEVRENIEVFLVAIAVAMAIRTFFAQPFKIPTGSMQPTLYGVTFEDLSSRPATETPGILGRIYDACVHGAFYHAIVAKDDGVVEAVPPVRHPVPFINKQQILVHYHGANGDYYQTESLWFSPDERFESVCRVGQTFRKGDYIFNFKEVLGDHLFVDRVTYNFRHPKRGEIIVFETRGINYPTMPQDQFYIKRLVALGGEKVQLGSDDHLIIDGKRLDASTPHFENVYTFSGPRRESAYHGHVNLPYLAPQFVENPIYTVRPRHYMVMGDNTMNSSDSRTWGDFSEKNVIGRSFFVYWPISNHSASRFGWANR